MADLRRHVPEIALTWDDEAPGSLFQVVDGTLVFADVSGFTALTEKLAGRGRIGAEQIVETLNGVFAPMLEAAAGRRGELLKFGGDALLFLFRGPGHLAQACDAVLEMRRALAAAAKQQAAVGRLRLSMSVGVHSGDIHLFLVGAPTRELMVLGPAATQTARAEAAARAGEVVLSPAAAALLPPDATRLAGGVRVLRRRTTRTPAPGASNVPEVPPERLTTLFPRDLGDYLAPLVPDPEHRVACIAFARFSGTDRILAEQGPEFLARQLHDTVSVVNSEAAAEGVSLLATDLDADGGKFFLGAGVPRAGGDDAGSMLRALNRVLNRRPALDLQIGVNRGHVFAAEVGISRRAAYSAMGDTTNTAARIMGKSQPGHILAHPSVLEHSRTLFEVTAAGPFTLKGKTSPVAAYDVGRETGAREAGLSSRLPFVGRQAEYDTLVRRMHIALSGTGSTTVITGPPGIGKSRLVQHCVDHGPTIRALRLRAEPYGSANAYRVFRDPLRALLGIARADGHEMAARMMTYLQRERPDLLGSAPLLADVLQVPSEPSDYSRGLDPQFRPDRVADTVLAVLDSALPGPLAIVVEDAQWADDASAHLLTRLVAGTKTRPWAVMIVHRGEGSGFVPLDAEEVTLGPLPVATAEHLVIAATRATPLRPHEISQIVQRADGNPMFLEEATRLLAEGGSADDLPESVQAALSIQIDGLHPHARRILRYASVLGRSFRTQILERMLAIDGRRDGLEEALPGLHGFLKADGPDRLAFGNSLVRDAAYEGLAYRTRTRLHAAAAQAVEQSSQDLDADAPILALHFGLAGDPAKTWVYASKAAAAARRAYANADAAAQFDRALDAATHLDVETAVLVEMLSALGETRELAGMLPQSVAAYRRAAQLAAPDLTRVVELLVRRARVHERAGEYRAALLIVARARRLLPEVSGDPARRLAARLDTLTALIRLGQEKPAQARSWAVRAVDLARQGNDPETLVQALMAIDFADQHLGRDVAGEYTQEALGICVAYGFRPRESVARANLGAYAFYAGRWREALEWYETSKAVALAAGNEYGAAECDLSLGDIFINLGWIDDAERVLTDAVRVLRASGLDFAAAYGQMQLARAWSARGDHQQADALASAVVAEFITLDHPFSAYEATLVQVESATGAGDPARALAILGRAQQQTKADITALAARSECLRCAALLELRQFDEAEKSLHVGLEAALEQNLPYDKGLLLRLSARLHAARGDARAAEHDESAARQLLASLGI